MDTTLVAATLVSLAMATALSVVVWRLLRDERRRSNARVAALTELATRGDAPIRTRPIAKPLPAATEVRREPRPVALSDLPLRKSTPGIPSAPLFAQPEHPSAWRRRGVVMIALALAGATVVLLTLTIKNQQRISGASDAVVSTPGTPSLELLSLRDARDANGLTITGLVENPRHGARLTRVTVTAFAFDQHGGFLASGRALLDVTSLAPGDESPFVVSVPLPTPGPVARYRVSFRGEDGRVISHVDKRQQSGAIADAGDRPPAGI